MATTNEIVTRLIAAGVAATFGTDIFIDILPDNPDTCVAVYNAGGARPTLDIGSATITREYPTIQIRVRGAAGDSDTPRATAQTAYENLAAIQAATLTSTFYYTAHPIQPPFILERDKNRRVTWAFNVALEKALS